MFRAIKEWWKFRMFKKIIIELNGPICTCEEENLAWGTGIDKDSHPTLEIFCRKCGTKLLVPNKKFVARFKLDNAYPGKKTEEPKVEKTEMGNVIPFPKQPKNPNDKDSA